MTFGGKTILATALVLAAISGSCLPSDGVVPGPDRLLFAGPLNLKNREADLGRTLDAVRIYTTWNGGPDQSIGGRKWLTSSGQRTLVISTTIPWTSWRSEADKLDHDSNPNNDVPLPYCKDRPVRPGTSTPSGKTWFRAIADGDYDTALRTWLTTINDTVAANVDRIYVSLHHEADRLSADAASVPYQQCVGTPDDYRAAWARFARIAAGTAGPSARNLRLANGSGKLVLVPIFTTWGFWHEADTARALANPNTGLPKPKASADDASLRSARVTLWEPADADYDVLGTDLFNYSGATAGGGAPKGVKIDDPATPQSETSQWRDLSVLAQPVLRWSSSFALRPDHSRTPLFFTEYGSVPDPTRPERRADWLARACSFLTDPAQSIIVGAGYFDVNQMRLQTWNWQKRADGAWNGSGPTGTDTTSVAMLARVGASQRFGGSGPCPNPEHDD